MTKVETKPSKKLGGARCKKEGAEELEGGAGAQGAKGAAGDTGPQGPRGSAQLTVETHDVPLARCPAPPPELLM